MVKLAYRFKLLFTLTTSTVVFFTVYLMTCSQYDISNISEFQEEIQNQRRLQIEKVCNVLELERNLPLKKDQLDHIIVDDNHQLLYCYVPKVACTNWKRVLMILNNKSNIVDPLSIPANDSHQAKIFRTLNNYSKKEIEYRIKKYIKFLFVRHPFDRLVSAYRNKFTQNYNFYFHLRYGKAIIQKFRRKASNESLLRGHDVTLNEFVRYLIDPKTHRTPLNEHWRPVFNLCHPCHIQYDIVGKFESLNSDAYYVLNKLKIDSLVQFPKKNRTNYKVTENSLSRLSKKELFSLYQLYAVDFKMFGYSYSYFDEYLPDV